MKLIFINYPHYIIKILILYKEKHLMFKVIEFCLDFPAKLK